MSNVALGKLILAQVQRLNPVLLQRRQDLADLFRSCFGRRSGRRGWGRSKEERADNECFGRGGVSVRELGDRPTIQQRVELDKAVA